MKSHVDVTGAKYQNDFSEAHKEDFVKNEDFLKNEIT